MWRAPCALCERRFMRSSLPGVVVMKRIYDLRRKWGVIQNSKKTNSPSVLYGTANVCLQCQEILTHEEIKLTPKTTDDKAVVYKGSNQDKDAEITRMIHDSILYQWHKQPPSHNTTDNSLEDIAVNKRVRQSSTVCSMKAQNALDPDTNRSAHTKEEFQPWWEIDLANYVEVHSVKVYLRDEVSHLYAAARGNPSGQTTRVYPLHISISMKSGVGRNCDDIIAGSVSSMCIPDNMGPLIEFIAPQKSRGRFVRVQCQGRAILHIERVNVTIAKAKNVYIGTSNYETQKQSDVNE
ncbi:Cytohesin-4 [Phytophthora nicotianae]|uniref:Cytohesin-4 n=1 Tax=Phytophthora nicotianae TaxID=4792 RepID=A0A0W8D9C1_PHYNI|nr:Cytohesin-4 [Phytophthora nicotianae]